MMKISAISYNVTPVNGLKGSRSLVECDLNLDTLAHALGTHFSEVKVFNGPDLIKAIRVLIEFPCTPEFATKIVTEMINGCQLKIVLGAKTQFKVADQFVGTLAERIENTTAA